MWFKHFMEFAHYKCFIIIITIIIIIIVSLVVTITFRSMKLWLAKQMSCTKSSSFLFCLNACVLFICTYICKIKLYKHTLFIPSLFTSFFSGSLQISVIDFNHFLFTGIFIWFFRSVSHTFFSKFVHRLFHRVFQRCFLGNFLKLQS